MELFSVKQEFSLFFSQCLQQPNAQQQVPKCQLWAKRGSTIMHELLYHKIPHVPFTRERQKRINKKIIREKHKHTTNPCKDIVPTTACS